MMNGGDILTLQKVLGHATLAMTQKHAHFSPGHIGECCEFKSIGKHGQAEALGRIEMIVASYTRELNGIKSYLSAFSHYSVFNCALRYLDQGRSNSHMPWVVMFLLKLSLLEVDGRRNMGNDEFLVAANRVYKLSNKLLEKSPEIFMLMMRAMVIQQLGYQVPAIDSWRHVILQRVLLEKSYALNNQLFYDAAGLTLEEYYRITNYLLTLTSNADGNSVIRYSLSTFYSHLSPGISGQSLANFLKLVSLPFVKLPHYLSDFAVKDCNSAELFQETPLKFKPIVLESEGLVIINSGLCIMGIRSIALDVLKKCPGFGGNFGVDVEAFIGDRLRVAPLVVYSIPQLNQIIPIKIGKVADYVVVDAEEVFIVESKAITPTVLMRCAYDPSLLADLLKDSFIKGVEQGQETAFKLSSVRQFKSKRTRILVVTLDDFFIYGGQYVTHYVKEGFEQELNEKYGCLPVQMQDVIYITLKDLLTLTEWLRDKPPGTLTNLFNQIEEESKAPGGTMFSLSQKISEKIGPLVKGAIGVGDALDRTQAEFQQLIESNQRFRRGQSPASFMEGFDQFRHQLAKCFA